MTSIDEARFNNHVGIEYLNALKKRIGEDVVAVDPAYFRPTEVDLLIGDPSKAMKTLGWKPEYSLSDIVTDMMQSDVKLMKRDTYLRQGGFETKNYYE